MVCREWIFCLLLLGPLPALANDCSFVPDSSLCGLPLDAVQARFDAVLGAPDGTLQMGPQRTGLLYGRHLLLVFENDRVVEVHSWEQAEPAFLAQLGSARSPALRLTLGSFNPWSRSRQQIDLALENRPLLAADHHTQTRALGRSHLRIRFQPHEVGSAPAQYRVAYLQLAIRP